MCYNGFMTKTCQTIALFFLVFLIIKPSQAIDLQFPVGCQIMGNCWITNHVDLRGNTNLKEDYMCGQKVTHNNKSTHISLESLSALDQNIPVTAAADGVVTIARNVGGFCGQRILIEHEKGWETSYCHLKSDAFVVREGQNVVQGQIMAAVGQSGQADWPRLSFAVIRNDMIFDPFSGRTNIEGCTAQSKPLWKGGLNPIYEPANITSIGFTVERPKSRFIEYGINPAISVSSEAPEITLYGMMMNVLRGDIIDLKITAPTGRIVREETIDVKANLDRLPLHMNAERGNLLWDMGYYRGDITITRYVNGNKITLGKFTNVEIIRTE